MASTSSPLRALARGFSSRVGRRSSARARGNTTNNAVAAAATAPPPATGDEWTEVKDEASGLVYYWNQHTNETTALGEPKPGPEGRVALQQQVVPQQGSVASGLGGMVAAGAGIGLGHAVGGAIGSSLFGGGD